MKDNQEMCIRVVETDSGLLQFVPVTHQQVEVWCDESKYDYDYDIFSEWYNRYKKKEKKRRVNAYCLASIKVVELVFLKMRKKETEKLWK